MIRSFLFYLALMLALSCTSTKEEKNIDTIPKPDTLSSNNNDDLQFKADSVELPSFQIEVSLSQKAEEKIKAAKETVIVAAYFTGIPKDTTLKDYLKYGEIPVTTKEVELTGERVAKFEGVKFSRSLYDSLNAKSINLLINVYSGRRSTKNNLLDCDILSKPVSEIKGRKFVLKGKLIGE